MEDKDYIYKIHIRDKLDPLILNRLQGLRLLSYRKNGGTGLVNLGDQYPELDTSRIVLIEKEYKSDKSGVVKRKKLTDEEIKLLEKVEENKQLPENVL